MDQCPCRAAPPPPSLHMARSNPAHVNGKEAARLCQHQTWRLTHMCFTAVTNMAATLSHVPSHKMAAGFKAPDGQ